MKRKRYPQIRFKGFNNDWEQCKIEDTFNFLSNNSLSRAELSDKPTNFLNIHYGDILIKYGEILDINKSEMTYLKNDDVIKKSSNILLKNGDVVVADTAEDETVGKCCEIMGLNDEKAVAGLHTISLNPKEKFESGYLGYYMNSNSFHNQLLPLIQGIKVSSISKSAIANTIIKFPIDNLEQEKLAKIFSSIDNLITLHQNKHDKLVEIKKSLLEKMFPKNNEKIPEIRFKGFTDNWKQHKLDELGIIQTGNTPSTVKKEYYSNTGIQWVTPTDITDNVIRTTERKLSRIGAKVGRIVPPNTILVTCIASIGKNAIVTEKSAFNQQINSLTPYFEKHNPYFLLADSINWSNTMKKEAGGLTFQIVNKSQFSKIETKVPKEKQEEEKIGVLFKTIDKLVTLYQHNLINLINLKKTLLRKMFI